MKTWSECCQEVGFDPEDFNPPEIEYSYYAYKEGKCSVFYTLVEARQYSSITEKVVDNNSKQKYDLYCSEYYIREAKASDVWEESLREEFSYLNNAVFQKCYSEAYDRGHSDGRNSVYYKMCDIVEFVEEILECLK